MIASATIVLAWLKNQNQNQKQNQNQNQKIDGLTVLITCRFGTSETFFSNPNNLVSDDNARE